MDLIGYICELKRHASDRTVNSIQFFADFLCHKVYEETHMSQGTVFSKRQYNVRQANTQVIRVLLV